MSCRVEGPEAEQVIVLGDELYGLVVPRTSGHGRAERSAKLRRL